MTATRQRAGRRLDLSVQYACAGADMPDRHAVRTWVRAALPGAGQVTVRFVEAEESQTLNRDYRGKDHATNVLSFPYATEPLVSGDLAVCMAVAAREAALQSKTLEAHLAHLIVHGILHLQGYDHEQKDDAEVMEDRERHVLAVLGYDDPYSLHDD